MPSLVWSPRTPRPFSAHSKGLLAPSLGWAVNHEEGQFSHEFGPRGGGPQVGRQTNQRQTQRILSKYFNSDVEAVIKEVKQLRSSGAVRPSFLLAWAVLEAEARRLIGNQLGRPQTPGRVVQMLGQEGYLPPDEADSIRRLADVRNRLIHGELSVDLSRESLDQLLAALDQLRAQEPSAQG